MAPCHEEPQDREIALINQIWNNNLGYKTIKLPWAKRWWCWQNIGGILPVRYVGIIVTVTCQRISPAVASLDRCANNIDLTVVITLFRIF